MTHDELIVYIVFGAVLIPALIFDLGLLSKKGKTITIRQALIQTLFWVGLAMGFFVFMLYYEGTTLALQFLSGYLMEWTLSIDNIFIFIVIFSSFAVKEKHYGRILLIGILMAIVFRIIFITVGVALVAKFHWIMYVFGAFLLYTGYKMFTATDDEEFDPHKSKVYKLMGRMVKMVPHDGNGKLWLKENGKTVYTTLFITVVMLAFIDIVFAIDSIPAIMGITTDKMVIYTSNIFAVLGLRSLFFLLRNAASKFDYLQQGISIVLVFIGLKMLLQDVIDDNLRLSETSQVIISLGVILLCIGGSIWYSITHVKKGTPDHLDSGVQSS